MFIHHSQGRFVPELQYWVHVRKMIHVIRHIDKIKEKTTQSFQ